MTDELSAMVDTYMALDDDSDVPTEMAPPPPIDSSKDLSKKKWYWGVLTRADVSELMQDRPDGSFLVRDASTIGDYTLTVRKGGVNRLVKICQYRLGSFGFSDQMLFDTVVDLVNYFSDNSLSGYNSKLDIKLLYPVENTSRKSQADEEEEKMRYRELLFQIKEQTRVYNNKVEEQENAKGELLKSFLLSDGLGETLNVYEEQIELQREFHAEASARDLQGLHVNYNALKKRFEEIEAHKHEVDNLIAKNTQHNRKLIAEVTEIKNTLNNLSREIEKVKRWLIEKTILPHLVEQTWRVWCDRSMAMELLKDKPEGTFLIRQKITEDEETEYALSIISNGKIVHIKIHIQEDKYGISRSTCQHDSLVDLVIHYENTSLKEHNPKVDVKLTFPFRMDECLNFYEPEPIYG